MSGHRGWPARRSLRAPGDRRRVSGWPGPRLGARTGGWTAAYGFSAAESVLARFGGYQAAAGLDVRLERLDELRELFGTACASGLADPVEASARSGSARTSSCSTPRMSRTGCSRIARLEPCGECNPSARLAVEAALGFCARGARWPFEARASVDQGRRVAAFGPGMVALPLRFRGARWCSAAAP